MDVTQTGANAQAGSTKANVAQTNLASNFDDFLTLLTTQLTNQDPLNPTDSTEFTNQLVNFTNVEQSIATNQNLESLIQLQQVAQQNSQAATMIDYLGKKVGSDLNIAGLKDGNASWDIDLGANAASATYDIYDKDGNKVYTETNEDGASAGEQTFTWDGKKTNGTTAPDGAYYLVVTATTAGGNDVSVTNKFEGIATSVESEDGVPVLKVNGVSLGLQHITSVRTADSDTSA
ncbi:MAG: flagellar hook assembly protein FlgD [Alphaproteobacteria bacterium]|nr:MAG: flagellar hook assembly protein FlgD [Alphaproteobacteria bacterium]